MNEIRFSEGGQPIALDDLKQLNDNDVYLLQLLASLCEDDCVLAGCKIEGRHNPHAQYRISKGLVAIQGNVYEFDGAEVEFPDRGLGDPASFFFVPSDQEQTSRPMEFADGSTHPTRTRKVAVVLKERPSTGGFFELRNANSDRAYIPKRRSYYDTYTITQGEPGKEQEVGYIKLYHLEGLDGLRLCELVIKKTSQEKITAGELDGMWHLNRYVAGHLNFSIATTPIPSTPLPYHLFIFSGAIQLYRDGVLQKSYSGNTITAIGLVKVS